MKRQHTNYLMAAIACIISSCGNGADPTFSVVHTGFPIHLKTNGYKGNMSLNQAAGNGLFYVTGEDTILYVVAGSNWIDNATALGYQTAPTSYIYFDVDSTGKVTKVYNTAACTLAPDGKTLILQTTPIVISPVKYNLYYNLSSFHVNWSSHLYQQTTTTTLIKGLKYAINNGMDVEPANGRCYFYFTLDSMGNIAINDTLQNKYDIARVGHDTIHLNTTAQPFSTENFDDSIHLYLMQANSKQIAITKDTTINLISGLTNMAVFIKKSGNNDTVYFIPQTAPPAMRSQKR
jgi:hypothetical protein